jgi:hypothetical protein
MRCQPYFATKTAAIVPLRIRRGGKARPDARGLVEGRRVGFGWRGVLQ